MMARLERPLKQYIVLKNPELIELFNQKLIDFKATQSHILQSPLLNKLALKQLASTFGELNQHLSQMVKAVETEDANRVAMDKPYEWLANISDIVDNAINDNLRNSQQDLKTAELHIVLLGSLVVPLSILLFVYSLKSITRPVQSLSRAINLLGRGRWQDPINIVGPLDLTILGQRLEWMRRQLKESDEQKKLILRHVTHELKTPLSAIMEAASLLRDEIPGQINEKQAHVLDILKVNSETLNNLIATMLSYNTALVKQSTFTEELDLQELVSPLIKELSQSHKQIEWQIPDKGLVISTDRQRVEMILRNLFSNAIYYSKEVAKINVDWKQNDSNWYLSVKDNGLGIEESELEKVFEPFYQGNSQRQSAVKGSGIGLAIVKECVETMQGEISVTSELNQGTEFTISFPNTVSIS